MTPCIQSPATTSHLAVGAGNLFKVLILSVKPEGKVCTEHIRDTLPNDVVTSRNHETRHNFLDMESV